MMRVFKKVKSRLRSIVVVIIFGLSFLVPGLRHKIKAGTKGKTRALLFHHIDSRERFESIISDLVKNYNVISYQSFSKGDVSKDKINIIITFDDGYVSWYSNALPVLKKYNISPIAFINTDFIGLDEASSFDYCVSQIGTWPENSLSWEQIKAFHEQDWLIGLHGIQHADMTNITSECLNSNLIIEQEVLFHHITPVSNIFSYPFGRAPCNSRTLSILNNYVEAAFITDSGFIDDSACKMLLKRTNVGMRHPFIVRAYVEGYLDSFTKVYAQLRGRRI